MNINNYFLLNNLPTLDLHGFDRDCDRVAINEFVYDNYRLKNELIVIIHGVGKRIIQKTTDDVLRKNKYVLEYKRDYFNSGCTIVRLKI